ncbi:hypothetical protein SF1_18490 [Sphingobacterium faecium NBRC 15299]|uniref:DUF262 domain-containing protein n=1 Tax=Sphingobacterium faecium TaxID=34087 RepID=UPI000D3C977A|nr:DUF262 domain-containing protein [Sphingobacterium faecium]PTX09512.1 uncharacterized protein DUF262 [Sphingobacterium faecium]GEM63867.1 hypothetical protein SF1_18490 [Sphingobacterium faecium NBRC 15299]
MENRVYYGQYNLKHWIDLILKQNIVLPNYQRFFVWNEKKVETLIKSFKKKQFVPPITIGLFKIENGKGENLILDGQQRLTSILLAYLGLYPDQSQFKATLNAIKIANENDDDDEEEEDGYLLDNILSWDFEYLTQKGNNKEKILSSIAPGNYKTLSINITDKFLEETYLGFSYLVPFTKNEKDQLNYYSSVFRNINLQGEKLLEQESRAPLYFLNSELEGFFDPEFVKAFTVNTVSVNKKVDFARFLALLSQYDKDGNTNKIARGYKQKMEEYYEEYIYSVVGESTSSIFINFNSIFPTNDFKSRYDILESTMNDLEMHKQYTSIIDLDMYFLGLIYLIVYKEKTIDTSKKTELFVELNEKIALFKSDEAHKRAPSALKYLKERINASIDIYNKYTNA